MLAACAGNNGNTGNNGNEATEGTNTNTNGNTGTEQPAGEWAVKKFDPPVTVTSAIAIRDSDKLRGGDTPENNPITRYFEETNGIKTKWKWLLTDQNDALNQKIRLALASGEELPDVLAVGDAVLLNELIESGSIMSIDEAFEKYASPRTKEAYEKNKDVWQAVTKDGKKWALPQISDGFVGDPIMWIREDWLKAVNMKAPTNLEEFEAVLAAFKKKYPDKTPLAVTGKNTQSPLSGWMGDVQFLFGSTQPYIWDKDANGKLQYGSVQPTAKDALVKLNDWFNKGYISKEFGTHDEQKATSIFTAGDAGIVFGPGWMGGWPISDTLKNVKGSEVKAYELPSGIDGNVGRTGTKLAYNMYVFRKGFDNMEAIFQIWDAGLGYLLEDEKNPFAAGFGEGYDYVMKDGKPSWDVPEGNVELRYLLVAPGNKPPGMVEGPSIYERVLAGKKDTVYEQKVAFSSQPLSLEGNATALKQLDKAHRNLYIGAPTKTYSEKWTLLNTLETETFIKIVYGKAKPEAFDQFVKDWKAKGGDAITEEVNAWYEEVK
ncbi:hypothetical protein SY83_22465 [Paenibacillus swuensis]|uniref:ABC transporter substrate-binding protein n=1 Tax=Paenibacillus swuensis TaxID=1178515 RepID=A0A172TQ23_9BACL|nr:hypothetical protein SY83_22465 [Paenibacillus swuensis]